MCLGATRCLARLARAVRQGRGTGFSIETLCRWAVHPRQQLDATYRTALGLFRLIFCVFPIDLWSHQTRRLKWLVGL